MHPVAITGMSALFPEADDVRSFWSNILQRKNCLRPVPPTHWDADAYYDPDPAAPDKTYCREGGFLPWVDFDPVEFGIPPNILEVTDVSQLLSLVVAKAALVDAGLWGEDAGRFDRSRAGVILGVSGAAKVAQPLGARLQYPVWERVLSNGGLDSEATRSLVERLKDTSVAWEESAFPGLLGNVIAGRICNRFDLGGTNCVIDAACASSLSALKMAVAELAQGHCDVMLTGGVDTDNSIFTYLCFSKTPALSRASRSRPFDRDSDGIMLGEGIGMMVLKRLEDAERDGDRIYAVIRGIGSSSDGRFKSIYAPRAEGQLLALERAYAAAGIPAATVGLVEAHGTGTVAGDFVEFDALRRVLDAAGASSQSVALGSVKSQIGHTKTAAGAAGMIKAALALHHKVLPPTINVENPNPKLDLEASPLYLNVEATPWLRAPSAPPRRAGVSAFGFGGTNFHVVLEEHGAAPERGFRLQEVPAAAVLHAPDVGALRAVCEDARAVLASGGAEAWRTIARAWGGRTVPRAHARVGFAARSTDEARALLGAALDRLGGPESESWDLPRGVSFRQSGLPEGARVVALFPGQGAQAVGMGRELAIHYPVVRQAFEAMDGAREAAGLPPVGRRVFPPPAWRDEGRRAHAAELTRTEHAQPALGALQVGLYRLLEARGFRPDLLAGHSFGELTALWAAGALDDAAFRELATLRGQAMAAPTANGADPGSMLAVAAGAERVAALLEGHPDLVLANDNGPEQVIVAGGVPSLERFAAGLEAAGVRSRRLDVSAAFHTERVAHAQRPFADAVRRAAVGAPRLPVYANATAEPYAADPAAVEEALAEQLLMPVRFREQIERISEDGGAVFVEVGPRSALTSLVRSILAPRPHVAVSLLPRPGEDEALQLKQGLAQLAVLGLPIELGDPEEAPIRARAEPRKGGGTVRVNGAAWVSERTRARMTKALEGGPVIAPAAAVAPVAAPPATATAPSPASPLPSPSPAGDLVAGLLEGQRLFTEAQRDYLDVQGPYVALLGQIARQQAALLETRGDHPSLPAVLTSLERTLAEVQRNQDELRSLHARYLEGQLAWLGAGEAPKVSAAPVVAVASVVAAGPVAVTEPAAPAEGSTPVTIGGSTPGPQAAVVASEALAREILGIISDHTGYPVDVLDPAMDLEADLGIDSIKRVEILSTVRERFPVLEAVGLESLTDRRTIADLMALLEQAPLPVVADDVTATSTGLSAASLLEIVSEHTGYPVDTLEMEMDLEADLGIDSIKRVEILASLRDRFPGAGTHDLEGLVTRRTLQEILSFLQDAGAGAEGFAVAPAGVADTPAHAPAAATSVSPLLHLAVVPRPLPLPDRLEAPRPERAAWLLVAADVRTAGSLGAALREKGHDALVVLLPEAEDDAHGALDGLDVFRLTSGDERVVEAAAAEVLERLPGLTGVIHLGPSAPDGAGAAEPALSTRHGEALARTLFLLAARLGRALRKGAATGGAAFVAVTRTDGRLGTGGEVGSGLGGLVKSLAREWPGAFCRVVDLHPRVPPAEAARLILAELADPARGILEVGNGPEGRMTLQRVLLPIAAQEDAADVTPEDVFVVSGGGGGVTAACVVAMARAHRCRFLLLGRSEPGEAEPSEQARLTDPRALKAHLAHALEIRAGRRPSPREIETAYRRVVRGREIRDTLAAVREAGGEALYVAVDVTDASAVAVALDTARALGPVTGLVHGAGALADRLIEDKTAADFDKVVAPKLHGLDHLLSAIPLERLRHLVLFSSVAGHFGNAGQADYAYANERLDKAAWALRRRLPGCRVVSLGWGAWDGGMVTEAVRRTLEARGLRFISREEGASAFLQALARRDTPAHVLLTPDGFAPAEAPTLGMRAAVLREIGVEGNPFLADHSIGGRPVLPATCALAWMAEGAEAFCPGYAFAGAGDLRVQKGIVFEEPASRLFRLGLEVRAVDPDSAEVSVECTISEIRVEGPGVAHYRATIRLREAGGAVTELRVEPPAAGELPPAIPDGSLYGASLFHGPAFQGVVSVLDLDDRRITTECFLPELQPLAEGRFGTGPLKPFTADVQIQPGILWAQHHRGRPCIPLAIESVEHVRAIPFAHRFFVTMVVEREQDEVLWFSSTAYDAAGSVYARFSGIKTVLTTVPAAAPALP